MSFTKTNDAQHDETTVSSIACSRNVDTSILDLTDDSVVNKDVAMGTIITKPGSQESNDSTPNVSEVDSATFYGVHLPHDNQDVGFKPVDVFIDKLEALRAAKKHPSARFKAFKSKEEAEEFALHGVALADISTLVIDSPNGTAGKENPNSYKTPKSQDMVRLRKSMEKGDLPTVEATIWENPRYLINCGETPAIMQEGSRYNALHIAAKSKNAALAELVIRTVSDFKFIKLFDGDVDEVSCKARSDILLDLYLNTPDKGLNETPLHFASKFGAVDVVEVLLSCAQCDKDVHNKFGQTPKDVMLSRCSGNETSRMQMATLFEGQFYVPVLRYEDNSSQPTIGMPFSPTCLPSLAEGDPLASRREIRAFAGPMDAVTAAAFRRRWKTPPRESTTPRDSSTPLPDRRRTDPDKGLEIDGRKLAMETGVDWKEYWPFLDTFVNLSSTEGLHKLESFLEKRFRVHGVDEDNVPPPATPEKVSVVREGGDGGGALSPMSELCFSLQACSLLDRSHDADNARKETEPRPALVHQPPRASYKQEEDLLFLNMLANPGLSPILYVEKSCQVFGRRIAAGLLQLAIGGVIGEPVDEMLSQEVRRLRDLVDSFMSDPRFISVDFHLVHSRIAAIVAGQLVSKSPEEWDIIAQLCAAVCTRPLASPATDEEESPSYRVQSSPGRAWRTDVLPGHARCVAKQICRGARCADALDSAAAHRTEADCVAVWADAHKCCCHWVAPRAPPRNGRKPASFKRGKFAAGGRKMLSLDDVVKRLAFSPEEVEQRRPHVESESEDEEVFYTPPVSPTLPTSPVGSVDSDEAMSSAEEDADVFLEGDAPSRTDIAVVQALDGVDIPPAQFPNVCRWRHMMSLMASRDLAGPLTTVAKRGALPGGAGISTPPRARLPPLRMPSTEGWHRVLPPSSPASPQFKSGLLSRSVPCTK